MYGWACWLVSSGNVRWIKQASNIHGVIRPNLCPTQSPSFLALIRQAVSIVISCLDWAGQCVLCLGIRAHHNVVLGDPAKGRNQLSLRQLKNVQEGAGWTLITFPHWQLLQMNCPRTIDRDSPSWVIPWLQALWHFVKRKPELIHDVVRHMAPQHSYFSGDNYKCISDNISIQ